MPSKFKTTIASEQQRLAKAERQVERKAKREAEREAIIEAARTADKLYLMKEISKRLGLLGLNQISDSEDIDGWSELARAYKQILDQVWIASEIGMDVRVAFDIDAKAISKKAMYLAARWSRGDDLTFDLPWTQRRPSDHCRHIQKWFTKLLLRRERQVADYLHHIAQRIGKHEMPIVSDVVLFSKQEQRKVAQEFSERNVFKTTILGRTVTVPFNDAASTAYKRASKLYVRARGFEKYLAYLGYCGLFVTISLPPEFHPNPSIGNLSWDGSTPLHGHESLQRKWRVFKGIYAKSHGPMIGLRVEEPHSDACTHWHLLIAIEPSKKEDFTTLLEEHFGGEPATKVAVIDPEKATAASYMMKYLLKATRADESAEASRYEAHRATWGMRSVVFFDHPGSSTLWDEFRRIKPNSAQFLALSHFAQHLHRAAWKNRYFKFLVLLELNYLGTFAGRSGDFKLSGKKRRVQIWYSFEKNMRGDKVNKKLRGILDHENPVDTHPFEWTIERKCNFFEPVTPSDDGTGREGELVSDSNGAVMHSYPSNTRASMKARP